MEDHETDGLTRKQRAFCHEYIVDLNGSQAAIRAGYSEATAKEIASENLTKPHIKSKIEYFMDLRAKRTDITSDRVLSEISTLAFSGEEDGQQLKALELLGKHLKLFTDKQELSGPNGDPIRHDHEHTVFVGVQDQD